MLPVFIPYMVVTFRFLLIENLASRIVRRKTALFLACPRI